MRRLYAIYGQGDRMIAVGRYRYTGVRMARRPGRVTGRLAAGGYVVRVAPAKGGAIAYRFTVRVGQRVVKRVVSSRQRRLTIPYVSKGQKVRVTVAALNEVRRASPLRSTTLVAR